MRGITGFGLGVLAVVSACSGPTDDVDSADSHLESVPDWDRAVTRPANESAAAASREACQFHRGALPAETLGAEVPVGDNIPIKTVVVLMQENRSFDSYFGHLNQFAHRSDIESAPENTTNPERINTPGSPTHPWQHAPLLCLADTNHEWSGSHIELNGGKVDGFFQANEGYLEDGSNMGFLKQSTLGEVVRLPDGSPNLGALTGERALWWYDERDIPFYYQLASTFAIGDHYHSSLAGPTYPNRDYLYAATSMGVTADHAVKSKIPSADNNVLVFDELEKRGVTWNIYVDHIPHVPRVGAFLGAGFISRWKDNHIRPMASFHDDARSGTLPQVVFIDANIDEDVNGEDEHPPGDIQTGQKFVADRVHELFASPQWKELALFITYDENGGLYDHVVPPKACKPDGIEPVLENSEDREAGGAFDQLGFRVPFMVVSPFAKKAFVSHKTYDHTSITRFIETKFRLPALTNRDANADPLFDFFDFGHPAFMQAPSIPTPSIDSTQMTACQTLFTPPQRN
jgi:phospholipase C